MIPKSAIIRITRPTDNLSIITRMYIDGLGFKLLGEFKDHDGFNGSIIGHPRHPYHFEFTHYIGTKVEKAPTKENLLIFYLPERIIWEQICNNMVNAGFIEKKAYNNYWDTAGKTYEDKDGYRVVLQNREWSL